MKLRISLGLEPRDITIIQRALRHYHDDLIQAGMPKAATQVAYAADRFLTEVCEKGKKYETKHKSRRSNNPGRVDTDATP